MTTSSVAEKLGGRKALGRNVETESDLIDAVRQGLPARALDYIIAIFAEEQIPQALLYRLIGSSRTLQRKRTHNLKLTSLESDRLARLARVLVRAEDVFSDGARSRRWLVQPNRALYGQRPLDLLDSDTGTIAVERILGRIEHGVYS